MLELTEEEKMILCESKYNGMNAKELDKRIKLHDGEGYKLSKIIQKRERSKKYRKKKVLNNAYTSNL